MVTRQSRFVLYNGELTDAPGRMETWTEYLTHLGGERWKLSVRGTDFSGFGKAEPIDEFFSTEQLLHWIKEQEDEQSGKKPRKSRLSALHSYARRAGLDPLARLIARVRRGTWPPPPARPRVTSVVAVKMLGAPHPRAERVHPYFQLETTRGPGIMRVAETTATFVECWLGEHWFGRESWKCRLNKTLRAQARARLSEYLENEPKVSVSFLTIVARVESIGSKWRGGTLEFSQAFGSLQRNSFLCAFSVMSSGELEEILIRLREGGLIAGKDFAVGEIMHGEWIPCSQIRFVRIGNGPLPSWLAVYDVDYKLSPNHGSQSDAADAPRA